MFDHVIITLILVVDLAMLYYMWQAEHRKAKARMHRRFNKILKSVGL